MSSVTLEEAAAQFLDRPRRGPDAVAEAREVRRFVAAFGAAQVLAAVRPGQVEDYEKRFVPGWNEDTDMARALRSNHAAQAHLRAVQTFLRWARRQDLTPVDLGAAIKLPAKS